MAHGPKAAVFSDAQPRGVVELLPILERPGSLELSEQRAVSDAGLAEVLVPAKKVLEARRIPPSAVLLEIDMSMPKPPSSSSGKSPSPGSGSIAHGPRLNCEVHAERSKMRSRAKSRRLCRSRA